MATATSILALGIGVNLAFLGTLQANLSRRPPHVSKPEELYELSFQTTSMGARVWENRSSYRLFEFIRDVLQDTAQTACIHTASVGFGRSESSRAVQAALVSEGYLELLGIQPALGRWFSDGEQVAAGDRVAVLDYDFWKASTDSSPPERLRIRIADQVHEVIGVLPEGFRGVEPAAVSLWLPLESSLDLAYAFNRPTFELLSDPKARLVKVLVRPAPGRTPAEIGSLLRGALVGAGSSWEGEEIHEVRVEALRSSAQGWSAWLRTASRPAFFRRRSLDVMCH